MYTKPLSLLCLAVFASPLLPGFSASSFYQESNGVFSTRPDAGRSTQTIGRFGPVGLSIELLQPAFTMRIQSVEQGSPAAVAGLAKGQYIRSINGEVLKDIDPRIQLGNWISAAEATDGTLVMVVSDQSAGPTKEVVVHLPVLGKYSPTWPLDCPKSDRIVRQFAEYLKQPGTNQGFADLGMLFLLSTGDESDLAVVRDWARAQKGGSGYPWHIGYGRLALCEYYLRTGDEAVMPAIQSSLDHIVSINTFGGWAGRGPMAGVGYGGGGGHMNAGGNLCVAFILLAKECGAEVADADLHRILRHFYRWVGRGNSPYGNNKPEESLVDNGRNGQLAFVMAAAASLTPDGEKSLYAKGRDINALFSFYSGTYMLHGHTGGGIGEVWRSAAMGLLYDTLPAPYRSFMDERRWHLELSRRFDGSFAILGGARYDNTEWGVGYALTYTVPRKTLRLTGAPRSPHSHPYALPDRLWGTAADDTFFSLEAPVQPDGTRIDLAEERFSEDSFKPVVDRLLAMESIPTATLRRLAHHPSYHVRQLAANTAMGIIPNYMWVEKKGAIHVELMHELVASADPRVRRAGLFAMSRGMRDDVRDRVLTRAVFDQVIALLKDPEESWFVKVAALDVVGHAPADWVVPEVGTVLPYLQSQEWWLQHSALEALGGVVADPRCYRKVLPAIAELARTTPLHNVLAPLRWGRIPDQLGAAKPEVAAFASGVFADAYRGHQPVKHALEMVRERVDQANRDTLAKVLTAPPGGYDQLFTIAKPLYPNQALPYEDLFLGADPKDFSPALRKAVGRIIETRLIPTYIGENRKNLAQEAVSEKLPDRYRMALPELVSLYQRMGVPDYDWQDLGPVRPHQMEWNYHSFNPPEKMLWDKQGARYRPITLPAGMENWFAVDFDADAAGWKTGRQPLGHHNGALKPSGRAGCSLGFCLCGSPLNTLWENEVLLMQGRFRFPAFREGHRYRLVVGGMSHVGAGEGYRIYVNGRPIAERPNGVGKRQGGRHVGVVIDRTWWEHFQGEETTLAVTSFHGIHKGEKRSHFSVWIQEMKVPPLTEEVLLQSASVLPMRSWTWQALQMDPDRMEEKETTDARFRWDGTVAVHPGLKGVWKSVAWVQDPAGFDPEKLRDANRARYKELVLMDKGKTLDPFLIYSGTTLMDLDKNEALRMQLRTVGGSRYLFVEEGGFNPKHAAGWTPNWSVLEQVGSL